MPTFDPDLAGALRSLQRQIDQINTSPPGPVSYGPGDHARFYGADGTTVLFEAVGGEGASVVSRGSLTSMTGLLDGIRDKNDDQDGTLGQHSSTLGAHSSRLDTLHSRANSQDTLNATQNGQISQLQSDLTYQTTRIDNRATVGQLDATNTRVTNVEAKNGTQDTRLTNVEARNTAQDGRLDTLHSRANSQDTLNATQNGQISQLQSDLTYESGRIDNRATVGQVNAAQSRADAAYALAAGRATQAQIESINDQLATIRGRVTELEEWRKSLPK